MTPMVTGAKGGFYIVGNREGNNAEVEVATVGPTLSPHAEANARRIVDCVNALAGIADPQAYMEAARGMREALEQVQKTMDGYRSQAKFCDIEALGYFREFDRRIETSQFRTAIATFDATLGEQ